MSKLSLPPKFIPPRAWAIKYSPREKTLAAWRGVNLAPEEKALKDNSKPLGDVLKKVVSGLRMDQRRGELEILKVWNNLMDPLVVQHAQPTNLVRGTLFITVDSSAWLSEIVRYRRKEILARLQHSFGTEMIARLSFRVG